MLYRAFHSFNNALGRPRPMMVIALLGTVLHVPLAYPIFDIGHYNVSIDQSVTASVPVCMALRLRCYAGCGSWMSGRGVAVHTTV